ncbi:MAG: hypothetical protein ACM3X4_10695 [Ignavibacteriales bacterium]
MMEVFLGSLSIATVRDNAGVFCAENTMQSWKAVRKANAVVYRVNGDGNVISSLGNYMADTDFVDLAGVTSEGAGDQGDRK